jgi:hypothetical protein
MRAFALQRVENFFDAIGHGASRICSSVGNEAIRRRPAWRRLNVIPQRVILNQLSVVSRLCISAWISGIN